MLNEWFTGLDFDLAGLERQTICWDAQPHPTLPEIQIRVALPSAALAGR